MSENDLKEAFGSHDIDIAHQGLGILTGGGLLSRVPLPEAQFQGTNCFLISEDGLNTTKPPYGHLYFVMNYDEQSGYLFMVDLNRFFRDQNDELITLHNLFNQDAQDNMDTALSAKAAIPNSYVNITGSVYESSQLLLIIPSTQSLPDDGEFNSNSFTAGDQKVLIPTRSILERLHQEAIQVTHSVPVLNQIAIDGETLLYYLKQDLIHPTPLDQDILYNPQPPQDRVSHVQQKGFFGSWLHVQQPSYNPV